MSGWQEEFPRLSAAAQDLRPTATLAECAATLGITKDTYAARLRRALKQAEKQIHNQTIKE